MPLLGSRGAASAKAFGLTSGGKLTIVSLTGSGNWVAPAGVFKANAVIVGGTNTPAYWSYPLIGPGGSWTSATTPTTASMNAAIAAWVAAAPSVLDVGAPSQRTVTGQVTPTTSTLSNGDSTTVYDSVTFYGPTWTIRNTFAGTTFPSVTVNIPNKLFFAYNSSNQIEILNACVAGGASSIFGSSAAGEPCPSGSASTVNVNNYTVVPGNSYAYVVAAGGSITVSYIG